MASPTISFRVSEGQQAAIATAAQARGKDVSAFVRELLLFPDDGDDEDAAIVRQLLAKEPGAVDALLALNPTSLVHRYCLGNEASLSLTLAYADLADGDGKRRLISALIAALDRLQRPYPDIEEMVSLTELFSRSSITVPAAVA